MNDQQVIETMQQIGELLLRKLQGNLHAEEAVRLNTWLEERDPADRQFFEDLANWDNIDETLHYLYQIDEDAALADVQNKIQTHVQEIVPPVPVRKMSSRGRYYRYAAAAVATGAIVTGTVLLLNRKHDTNKVAQLPVEQRYRQDVQPGGDKAVLTLADGGTIVLDDAQNGTITREGSTVINKLDGIVMYQSPGANTQEATAIGYNTLKTPRGGKYQLVLPDGSKVWLNAGSSITYPTAFAGNERKVEITGEAYFEVAPLTPKGGQRKLPFIVNVLPSTGGAGGGRVEVLGTHFNINAYDDETDVKVTLLEGSVKVANRESAKDNEFATVLRPGEQAVIAGHSPLTTDNSPLTIDHSPDLEQVIAWKNELFQFQDASIESIMRQVARWYDVEVEYKGKIEKQFVGKIPRRVPVSTLLKILESTGWVHFAIDGKKIIVKP
jgi:transmembrane sensor